MGDTVGIHDDDVERALSNVMDQQISDVKQDNKPAPAFYYILGDVVYYNGESSLYNSQFYEPYQIYHASILRFQAIMMERHIFVREILVENETRYLVSCGTFAIQRAITIALTDRPTMRQPDVYWTLNTPLATIVGLFSNFDGTRL